MTASRIVCFALAGVVGSVVSVHAALLGVAPGFPTLVYDNSGVMTYDSATDLFVVDAFPLAIRFTPADPPVLVVPTGSPATERVLIQIQVDDAGALSGGVAGDDLTVIGQVDQNGDSIPEFAGVLLTGEAAGFGFQESGGPTANFDFRFVVTGGAMASVFGGGTIGVLLTSENSTFPGGFDQSFGGFAKGIMGPIAFQCGDGFVDGGEECDNGADNSDSQPDACRTDCTLASCGDEVVDTGEQCDNGAANSDSEPNACRTDCALAGCGDRVVDTGEQCDNGAANSDTEPNACRTDCALAGCGDGVVDTGEPCDNGAANSDTEPNACRTDCARAGCGDDVVDTGEQCDDGNAVNTDCCTDTCALPRCGDGFVSTCPGSIEPCDDGNADDTDCCTNLCAPPRCGDGFVSTCPDSIEPCDDGNADDTDDCRNNCTLPDCADGIVNRTEETCDGSAERTGVDCTLPCRDANDPDECTCCGDNLLQGSEQCDNGVFEAGAPLGRMCRADCTYCGDNNIDTAHGEECDDGNDNDADNCSNSCITNVPPVGCRITGGRYVLDDQAGQPPDAAITRGQGGGQVGAPCGCIGCFDEFDHIQGQWQYSRKNKQGNFHAREFNSLICGCDQDGACNSGGVNGSAFADPAAFSGQLCNPGDPGPGPEPRPSPANVACFSGIGWWTSANGRKGIPVAFRVEVEDRGEPSGGEHADGTCDVFQIRIWIPGPGETAAELADQVCCIDGYDTIRSVRPPNIRDGGNLVHGNIQIHPQTPNSRDGTCPVPDGTCQQP